ncbi:MAG TPA: squalene cyclase, partial [Acidimicrobiia bacterium]|nr:squalene cyclase [Acidimicrobiia bacterium]
MVDEVPTRTRTIDWLLDGDPAIRWQTMRDLLGARDQVWRSEQERVGSEGWGAKLLEHQDNDGRWTPRLYGKKWISTTYTMVLLRRIGL